MTDAPKLEWHRFAGLWAAGVGVDFTEYFIIEQDEGDFRAMTVHAAATTYPLEEAQRDCEKEHRTRWNVTRKVAERKAALKAQKAALKKQRQED
jgi:hypothetical protein